MSAWRLAARVAPASRRQRHRLVAGDGAEREPDAVGSAGVEEAHRAIEEDEVDPPARVVAAEGARGVAGRKTLGLGRARGRDAGIAVVVERNADRADAGL